MRYKKQAVQNTRTFPSYELCRRTDNLSWGRGSKLSASKHGAHTPLTQNDIITAKPEGITLRGKLDLEEAGGAAKAGRDRAIVNRKPNRQLGGQRWCSSPSQVMCLPLGAFTRGLKAYHKAGADLKNGSIFLESNLALSIKRFV